MIAPPDANFSRDALDAEVRGYYAYNTVCEHVRVCTEDLMRQHGGIISEYAVGWHFAMTLGAIRGGMEYAGLPADEITTTIEDATKIYMKIVSAGPDTKVLETVQ